MQHREGSRPGLGFLQFVPLGPVCLVSDGVYVAPSRVRRDKVVRVGSLTAHAKALVDQMSRVHTLAQGPARQAQERLGRLPALRFCLLELIPYLRSLQKPGTFALPPTPDVRGMLDNAAQHLTEVQPLATQPRTTVPTVSQLTGWLGTPCAILGRTISPLKPIGAATSTDFDITIANARYRICVEQARPLSEVLSELDRRILLWVRTPGSVGVRQTAVATEFSGAVKKILDLYEPVDRGRYAVVYADRDHQVHHSCGRFLLVRGPVAKRGQCGETWVALELKGGSRPQLLGLAAQAATNPEMFWKAAGTPAGRAMCMGRREQYRHLLSNELTDAEAVVLWLDAGVILATGRSAFHQAWRGRSTKGVAHGHASMVRRRLRRGCL